MSYLQQPTALVQALYLVLVVGGYGAFLAAALPHDSLSNAHMCALALCDNSQLASGLTGNRSSAR